MTGGSLAWQNIASATVSASGSTDAMAGFAGYEYRTSTDGGATWSAATPGGSLTVSSEGQTLVQFRAVDSLGNGSSGAAGEPRSYQHSAHRPHRARRTHRDRRQHRLAERRLRLADRVGLEADGLSGVARYEYRTSIDGGSTWGSAQSGAIAPITGEGETVVQFRSVDGAENASPWAPASPLPGSTARIDHSAPAAPSVSGGSLSWTNTAHVTITGGGSADSRGSGVAGYQYRTSTDGGTTWTAPQAGTAVTIASPGQTLVQFRATDNSGLASAWTPGAQTSSPVRIDRADPTAPTVTGGSSAWQNVSRVTITAGGAGDALSGFDHYEYRTSTNGGAAWSSPSSGPANAVTGEGATITQFRSVDGAGNTSAWVPGTAGPANTAKIDRTAPNLPTASGGSLSWTNAATVTVTGGGSTDTPGSGVASTSTGRRPTTARPGRP